MPQLRRGEIELEARGSAHDPATGQVTFTNVAGTITYGSQALVQDAVDPSFGSYVFRVRRTGLGVCEPEVVATFNGATATGAVSIR